MWNIIRELCDLPGVSGREKPVRDYILKQLDGYCDTEVDALGNILAYKKGKKSALKKVMIDAHMDEVGIIVTAANERGFWKFQTVGGIETEVLCGKRVVFENGVTGVICMKPIHLCKPEEKSAVPSVDSLVLDIGAENGAEARQMLSPGDTAAFEPNFSENGQTVCSKALDNRLGCAVMIRLLQEPADYDFVAAFTVGEEVGHRGATVAAYTVNPDDCLVLETTTASDIPNGSEVKVCSLGKGPAVSFMDKGALYDPDLFKKTLALAEENGILAQTKTAATGGNNAAAIHLSRGGVKTAAVSVPCRYLHSPSCMASVGDVEETYRLAKVWLAKAAAGELS